MTPNYFTGDGSIGLMAGPGPDADKPVEIGVKAAADDQESGDLHRAVPDPDQVDSL